MPVPTESPPAAPVPIPAQDFVASLPAPVLRLLILFAGPIAAFRSALEVLSWKPERRVESFMLVGAWWAACLGGEYAFMWLLPPLVFAPLFPLNLMKLGSRSRPPVQPTPSKPATTETLLLTLGDLNKIYALLPPSPLTPVSTAYARFKQLGPLRIVRGLVVLWVSWIVLGRMLGLRILLALIGSGLLLLPSPPLAHVVNLMRKSLFMRRLAALQFVIVFGSPDDRDYALGSPLGWIRSKWAWSRRPAQDLAFEKALKAPEEEHAPADKAGNPIYFRFEVFENQRWWMGLDWTSALLPQERPSWCDVHSLPVSPPMAFTLPASSSIDVPAPTDAEPRAHVRRTATWRWLDDDWNVFKNTGDEKTSTTTSRPQAFKDEDAVSINSTSGSIKQQRRTSGLLGTSPDSADTHARAPSIAEAAFAKGLVRLKSVAPNLSSTPSVTSPVKPSPPQRNRTSSEASNDTAAPVAVEDILAGAAPGPQGQAADRSEPTDNDGWVYGDNKWENMGNKGGLGKFTRRRRWQRRAVCTETVHRIKELAPSGTVPLSPESSTEIGLGTPTGPPVSDTQTTPLARPGGESLQRSASSSAPLQPSATQAEPSVAKKSVEHRVAPPAPAVAPMPAQSGASSLPSRDEQLRLRLKKAMGSMGA